MSLKLETLVGVWVRVEGTNDEVAEFAGWCGPKWVFPKPGTSSISMRDVHRSDSWQSQGFYSAIDAERIAAYVEARNEGVDR